MKIDVLTLFPEMFTAVTESSILGKMCIRDSRDTGREGLPQTDRILTALQVRLLPQEAEALTTICRLT